MAQKLVIFCISLFYLNLSAICQEEFYGDPDDYYQKAKIFTQNFTYDSALYYARLGKLAYEGSPHWDRYLEMVRIEADMIMRQELKLDEATRQIEQNLPLAIQHLGPTHLVVAQFYHTLGNLQWYRVDYIRAIKYFEQALPIYEHTPNNTNRVSSILLNIGTCNFHIGEFDEALNYYEQALEVNMAAGDTEAPIIGSIFNSMGISHADRGDYDLALEYYRKSLRIKLKYHPTVSIEAAESYHNMAIAYKNKRDFNRSVELSRKARSIELALRGPEHPRVGDSYFNEANTYQTMGDARRALDYMDSTKSIYIKAFNENHPKLADMYGRMASMHLSLNNYDQAEELAGLALSIRKRYYESRRHPHLGSDYARIARIALAKQDIPKALDYFQLALINDSKSFESMDLAQSPDWTDIMRASDAIGYLRDKGKVLMQWAWKKTEEREKINTLVTAYLSLSKAVEFIDQHRITLKVEASKIYLLDNYRSVYDKGIELCYNLLSLTRDEIWGERAFQFAEKSKAMVLYEAIRSSGAKRFAGIPGEALELESRLKRDLVYYQEKTASLPSKELIQDSTQLFWIDQRFSLKQSYDSLLTAFEKEYPDYYRLKYSSTVSSLEGIQQQLPAHTTLLSYHRTDSMMYVFALDPKRFSIHQVSGNLLSEDGIRHYYHAISERNQAFDSLYEYSVGLYQQLISEPLEGFEPAEKLILIPDGALGYIPFDLLLTELPPETKIADYRKFPWLIRKYRTSYAYSATLLLENIRHKPQTNGQYLGFAPTYEKYQPQLAMAEEATDNPLFREWMVTLPGAQEEVQFAQNLFDGAAFVAEEATEGNFKHMDSYPAILHLAMHARVDDQDLANSELLFTPNPKSQEDGILNLSEIYTLELNSQLAVLSACNTGYGAIRKGEGIMSLSRAFMYAGCSSILTSLWRAKDQVAAEIMAAFYKHIQDGKPKEEALHLAKIEYLDHADLLKAHPANWAGFIIIGDPGEIQLGSSIPTYWWALILLILTASSLYIYIRKTP